MMWIYILLDDVCSDMSRFHGIRDITELDGPTFFALARRLPAYGGAVSIAAERMREDLKLLQDQELMDNMYDTPHKTAAAAAKDEYVEGRVLSAEELEALGPPAPEIGQFVGLFEVARCT
jgi:hypothetical protein